MAEIGQREAYEEPDEGSCDAGAKAPDNRKTGSKEHRGERLRLRCGLNQGAQVGGGEQKNQT
jgi:hypothetical protein